MIHESIKLAVINAGLIGVVLAPTYPVLRDSTQRGFFDMLERNEIPYDHQKSENIVTLTEPGSEILFRSANEFERLRGTNIAWFAFDELTYCEKEAWMRMMGRLRHPLAKKLAGIAAWTPKGFDWVYDLFIGPNKGEDYDAILATPRENLHLPADFYDTLARSYDTQFAKQELEGEYLNIFAGRCYHAFDRATHLRSGITFGFDPQAPICWSLDFNINPMCSVIVQFEETTTIADRYAGRRFQRAKVLDEIWIRNAPTLQACEEFGNRTLPWASRVHGGLAVNIYGDASGEARQTARRRGSFGLGDRPSVVRAVPESIPRHLQIQALEPVAKGPRRRGECHAPVCYGAGEYADRCAVQAPGGGSGEGGVEARFHHHRQGQRQDENSHQRCARLLHRGGMRPARSGRVLDAELGIIGTK